MIQLKYPVSKSKMAFHFGVERMFNLWSRSVYMWTLTFKKVTTYEWAMYALNQVMKIVQNENALIRGLRVVELHPGHEYFGREISHGYHFHFLVNRRICIQWLQRIGSRWGFGIIHVKRVCKEEALYLAKYLTKDGREYLPKGARQWGTIGGFRHTAVRDIEIDSLYHRNMRQVQTMLKTTQVTADIAHTIYVNTKLHGVIKSWPTNIYTHGHKAEMWWKENWQGLGITAEDRKKLSKLPRGNHRTKEQQMQRNASIWKEKARRIRLGHEGRVLEDWEKLQRERRVESETKPSGKKFLAPRGLPGDSPVKKQDYFLDTFGQTWDEFKAKQAGILPAIKES